MSTIEQELVAAADTRLLARAVQTAKRLRIPNAQALIESRFGELVSLNTTSEGENHCGRARLRGSAVEDEKS